MFFTVYRFHLCGYVSVFYLFFFLFANGLLCFLPVRFGKVLGMLSFGNGNKGKCGAKSTSTSKYIFVVHHLIYHSLLVIHIINSFTRQPLSLRCPAFKNPAKHGNSHCAYRNARKNCKPGKIHKREPSRRLA